MQIEILDVHDDFVGGYEVRYTLVDEATGLTEEFTVDLEDFIFKAHSIKQKLDKNNLILSRICKYNREKKEIIKQLEMELEYVERRE